MAGFITSDTPGRIHAPVDSSEGAPIVKITAIMVLSAYILGYLVLCGYGIAKTGATTGLSDIGSTALIVAVGALAVLVKGERQ